MPAAATPWRSRFAKMHPRAYLGVHALLGIGASVVLVWLFVLIADAIGDQGLLVTIDQFVTGWLQQHGTEWGESAFYDVSLLGSVVLVAVLGIAIVWYLVKRDRWRAGLVAVAGGGGTLLDTLLKTVFHRGRPEVASEFVHRQSWSFPSGHAMESTVGYGILAYLLIAHVHGTAKRRAFVTATVILVGLIGFSRVYLGVHYMSDVIGGFLAGGVWLLACIIGDRFARRELPTTSAPPPP